MGGVNFVNISLQIKEHLKSLKMIHEIRHLCFCKSMIYL